MRRLGKLGKRRRAFARAVEAKSVFQAINRILSIKVACAENGLKIDVFESIILDQRILTGT